ncbi:unnamed protein product [Vicia faba]|uniref:TF-B3 domain-containing protein n=1 Tax=Vicia faba TaxID=3906 RepID=A0AAV1A6Y1_VICFA|nr:unnamed protein product [Vicia faba]
MERGEEQTCNSFRSWQEEIYWTHFQFIHFTQFLNNHFQQLELPKTFSNNVRKKLPENVSLKSHSGVVWNIGLRTRDDSVYFTNGWQQFVKDHSLKENDFLVFKYNGVQTATGQGQNTSGFKSWQEDIYWTHFQFIRFTRFLSTHFEQQLALPKTFSNNVKKKLPQNVTIKGPSGVVYNVGLTTRDDSLFFTNGWQQFVKDHSLKENDFLVFKYNGKSHFEVLIFDGESFCEKATSYFVGKYKHAETEQGGDKAKETDNYVEEVNTVSNGGVECGLREKFRHINNIGTPLAAPFETPNGKTFNGRVQFASPEQVMADAVTKTAASVAFPSQPTGKRTKRPDNEASAVQNNRQGTSPIAGWKTDFFSMLSAKHGVTCHETSKGMPMNPKVSSKRKNKVDLSDKKLSKIGQEAVLSDLKKSGGASNTLNKIGQKAVLSPDLMKSGGASNTLKKIGQEAVLSPDLMKSGGASNTLNKIGQEAVLFSDLTKIVGVSNTLKKIGQEAVLSTDLTKSSGVSNTLNKIGQEAVLSTKLKKTDGASNTMKIGICSMSKTAHKKLATPKRHRVEDELSSQAKADLKMLASLEKQKTAEALNSPFPNFVTIMKKLNVSGSRTLRIPQEFAAVHLPDCRTELTLRNSRGECWTVNSIPDAKGGKAHTLCGGWMAFVRDNHINIGDTCVFELVSHLVLQVHVRGVGKEGLDHQNGNVKPNDAPSTC